MSVKDTTQLQFWRGQDGVAYTNRNEHSVEEKNAAYLKEYGITRTAMNEDFLAGIDRSTKILEIGANLGLQLENLRTMGFSTLLGVEVNKHAREEAKRIHPNLEIIGGTIFDLPFKDGWFDLVYTSGVLIHIAPEDLSDAMHEIHRVSAKYIWGFEYYASKPTEIEYRGKKGFLWKRNFSALYQELFPDLRVVKEKRFLSAGTQNEDQMFLLEKFETRS